uniref:protein fantom isoform X2 n=1 Tax=Doryrhamphus excisus TaxID=161450 RepID=UPI0025AE1461|nr:protein fantom isoform X2 [Doryrhamphus excisus]
MSPVMDETAGDLPVRDVGLMRGGLMPTVPDGPRDVKPWKKHHIMMTKDPQRLFRFPREQLEDLCLHLQEENVALRTHSRAQEQKMRRMSTRLMHHRQARPGSASGKERDTEDTLQELETRVATLESQKVILQNKLSQAKQHILDLGKSAEVDVGVRRAAQTAPPRYCPTTQDTRGDMEKFCVSEQLRLMELQLTTQSLRDTLQNKEREMEGTLREMKKQQVERHRANIRENLDVIRLQKQLSEKSAALRVTKEKITDLQQAYEKQLEENQMSLKESNAALLEKVEEQSEELKQERQRALMLEGQLTTASLSLQNLEKLQERMSDLEEEKNRIKESYDSLLESTLATYNSPVGEDRAVCEKRDQPEDIVTRMDTNILEGMLKAEREERGRLESEKETLRQEKEILEEQKEREAANLDHLEEQILQYKQQISALQHRLDSVTKEFDMSDEELSETLFQIKAFRMQQESREGLHHDLRADRENEDPELANNQVLHAETVLELQKTRSLLLLEHRISKDLQEELDTVKRRLESEREDSRVRMAEKEKVLSKKTLQINTLKAQLKNLAYNTKNHKRTIPIQYTWQTGGEELVLPVEDDISFSPLRVGESLLELHIKAATFTPGGLQNMSSMDPDQDEDMVTFCTYSLLDFEVHSTPLVAGSQPNYGFTSHYALTARDLAKLELEGSRVRVELHQAVGGVRFLTHGSGQLSLMAAMDRRGERINGRVNITGSVGEIVGVVDFWVRLFPTTEPMDVMMVGDNERNTATQKIPAHISLGWQDGGHTELYDFGGGIPNELVLLLEHCEGLRGRWPGLLPDAYLTYRFYDLQPHVSQTVRSNVNPVFHDTTSYPLAVTTDVLQYLRSSSLWVYVFDDSDDQIPAVYLAKTPIPLRALATGKEITGDYVLRDPAGGPRGTVRVLIKWKYPFQPPVEAIESSVRRQEAEESPRPIAKPRVKTQQLESVESRTKLRKMKNCPSTDSIKPDQTKRSSKKLPGHHDKEADIVLSHSPIRKSSEETSSRTAASLRRSSVSDPATQNISSMDLVSMDEEPEMEERSESAAAETSSETSTSDLIVSSKQKTRKGDKLRVEILSLTFEPSSHVALDDSVQRVYVEYRLLGVPMETTETPVSLRKPTKGEEIYYNFTRVIYVDGSLSAPLRQYLYTMLEGSDPNKGRLKFTVVSEPMDDDEECWDVGCSFLDLQELLLTGNDVIERQIDIVRVDDENEVIGFLKVSLEAAKALTGIYQEFHQPEDTEDNSDEEGQREE